MSETKKPILLVAILDYLDNLFKKLRDLNCVVNKQPHDLDIRKITQDIVLILALLEASDHQNSEDLILKRLKKIPIQNLDHLAAPVHLERYVKQLEKIV